MEFSNSIVQALNFSATNTGISEEKASRSLAAKIAEIRGLKTFPVVAQQVISILGNPSFKVDELAKMIKQDPSLAANVIRVANSAFFSRGKEVSAFEQAIIRLGRRSIREIVSVVATMDMFPDVHGMGKAIRDHCAATAALSQYLAQELAPDFADGIFICGLLHDIGKLLLIESGELLYSSMSFSESLEPDRAYLLELSSLGFDHGMLCGQILSHWNLPDPLPQVVAWHHQPSLAYQDPDIGMIVAMLRIADHIEPELPKEPEEYGRFLELFPGGPDCKYAKVKATKLESMWDHLQKVREEALSLFGG
ncbi:MAG: HDOD domain-containing protein [Proteobacteria bacterium]|nr:HDOD domain-containing protein [Pseudomonadota bacterium]